MQRMKARIAVAAMALAITIPVWMNASPARGTNTTPTRVIIVLFDQMVPKYADQFDMPNFRAMRGQGTNFKNAYLGYMASETVISHNVIVSGQLPVHQGWVDEAYRDTENIVGPTYTPNTPSGAMHITGDFGQSQFDALVAHQGYQKLQDYLHSVDISKQFVVVGEKSYAVRSAIAPAVGSNLIAVHMSSGRSATTPGSMPGGATCVPNVGGTYRQPQGYNVPDALFTTGASGGNCGRFVINADLNTNSYGTTNAFPSWLYPEEGNRFFPGTDASAQAGHLGGDVWAADAAILMMQSTDWSGMFVTLGAIDKAAHMWGAQQDAGSFKGDCNASDPAIRGANQTHVRCAAEIADAQLGKLRAAAAAYDTANGGQTLFVLTADHGANYGKDFYGKKGFRDGDTNWYYGPGVYDGGVQTSFYTNPSPSLQPLLATGNIQFSYQSTAVEAWLADRTVSKLKQAAAATLKLPGTIASYYRSSGGFMLYGKRGMSSSERDWWNEHGQELVNTLASPNGPDVVGLLHDNVSYGVYGDHGGAQKDVQRVPVVFWSPSMSAVTVNGGFRTIDILPTILQEMDIPAGSMNGTAWTVG
jgi:hypothetical protein